VKQTDQITLENLGNGAASEMFQAELESLIANVADPNTKPDAVRTIMLKVKVKPDKKARNMCAVEVHCESKLAPSQPFETIMFVGMEHGEAKATEHHPAQGKLFVDVQQPEEPKSNLVAMGGGKR
jgi:hypothetical protein